jgi:hypothetical protein
LAAILGIVAFGVVVVYVLAPFALYGVFIRMGIANDLLAVQNSLLTRLLAAPEKAPETPIDAGPKLAPCIGIPTFRTLR